MAADNTNFNMHRHEIYEATIMHVKNLLANYVIFLLSISKPQFVSYSIFYSKTDVHNIETDNTPITEIYADP